MSKAKEQFPAKDGWLRMTLTMTTKTPLSEDRIKDIASFGNADKYEWGQVEQYGSKLKVICRRKNAPPLSNAPIITAEPAGKLRGEASSAIVFPLDLSALDSAPSSPVDPGTPADVSHGDQSCSSSTHSCGTSGHSCGSASCGAAD